MVNSATCGNNVITNKIYTSKTRGMKLNAMKIYHLGKKKSQEVTD